MKSKLYESNVNIEKKAIRRYFYLGSIIAIILPSLLLITIYSNSLQKEYEIKVQQLTESIVAEKKRSMRNAIDHTIYFIEVERKQASLDAEKASLTNDQIEALAKERITQAIRGLRLIDNGYIWINKIVNYEGGDNYAIRLIHPNLPDTEGSWLSTLTKDSQGNRPYKVELEGVKENGDVFFEYYFKKMGSNQSAHKMSYAKLYAPYDWVIATGIYLDDVDKLIIEETKRMQSTYESQKTRSLIITFLAVISSLLIMAAFENRIQRLIHSFEMKLNSYTCDLEKISITDRLTGLFNRFKIDQIFINEMKRADRYSTEFSLLMIDIDWFKKVNDQFGHQVGDKVIQDVAKILLNRARSTDSVGRWGGEEFLIICPETSIEGAKSLGEQICADVGANVFSKNLSMTCSIGVSSFQKNESKEDLFHRADQALYLAKNSGRNQVRIENEI